MNFFGIGLPEMLVILLLLFLLFGPKRLPEIARSVGEGIREFKKSLAAATAEEVQRAPEAKEEPKSEEKKGPVAP